MRFSKFLYIRIKIVSEKGANDTQKGANDTQKGVLVETKRQLSQSYASTKRAFSQLFSILWIQTIDNQSKHDAYEHEHSKMGNSSYTKLLLQAYFGR